MTTEIIYSGHDNAIEFILEADDVAVDLSPVTRVTLSFGNTVIDTDDDDVSTGDGGMVDWSAGEGKLILRLGGLDIAAGKYNVRLVVYDPGNANGIVWGKFPCIVE